MERWESERNMRKMHLAWMDAMSRRRVAIAAVTYALAGAGGIIYARQWDHLAPMWCLLVLAYAAILIDGRLVRLARQG